MAGPAPKTRGWHALENAHKPKGWHVIVGGVVQVSATNKEPLLTETPERNPKNLGLKLTIGTSSGQGAQVVVSKVVHFHKEVQRRQYDDVTIRWDAAQIGHCKVFDDAHYAAEADAAMKALNQKFAKLEKPAAKKAAPKKAAAAKKKPTAKKKSAAKKKPRSVGGWAKGKKAKKKVPKKAAKKSANRKAKKSRPAKKKRR